MCSCVAGRWWRPFRVVAGARIFRVDLAPHAEHEASALTWLDADEQIRSRRFRHAGPRRRFDLCRSALRALLSHELSCNHQQLAFGATKYGKPFAIVDKKPNPISFNLSHSHNHGLIALAPKGRLGVDIEDRVPRDDLDELAKSVLGPDEQRDFAGLRGSQRTHFFFRMWTLKEALIKALGVGFSLDPAEFEVPLAMRRGATTSTFRFPDQPDSLWRVDDLGTDDFAAAIAVEEFPQSGRLRHAH